MSNDPFSQPVKPDRCTQCEGLNGAHYVWCTKLDEVKRRH